MVRSVLFSSLLLVACGPPAEAEGEKKTQAACPVLFVNTKPAPLDLFISEGLSSDSTQCATEQRPLVIQEGCVMTIEGDAKVSGKFTLDANGKGSVTTSTGTIDIEVTVSDSLLLLITTYRQTGTDVTCRYSSGNLK